ncbi:MAG: 23S rRNA (cytosine(1962)-C(5))-methyltransferase RlmI [Desulfobacteraceae bacterium]|jgi:23S rRNA (cytosine1962-C5)-methyltransferase|nr:MAG: 23S rRNA (cytosine(1962)-C(5))-methyltransferase RlmI [Desulfobacteraceae bacterium]
MPTVELARGREKSVINGHPWIFSGAIDRIKGSPGIGETVKVAAYGGEPLGLGAFSPGSQIRVRMWSNDPDGDIDRSFFRLRIERAVKTRVSLPAAGIETTAYRLVNGESDWLPGLIVDRYGDFLVCQFLSAGPEYFKDLFLSLLSELKPLTGIFERSDADVREKEGLALKKGLLWGCEPPELIEITEGPCRFLVDIRAGQKTGFFLDQRANRARLAAYCNGAELLNCFSYTGAFAVRALKAGALFATNLDESGSALELCSRNMELNGIGRQRFDNLQGNAFKVLRQYREQGRRFDIIVLDPPRFVDSRSHLMRASRGYKDINLLALNLLRSGGYLFTFSCSGLLSPELFLKIVADAALDAGREVRILERLGQAPDHPVGLHFPEGNYLKGLICRVW